MITQSQIDQITESVEAFNDLARNEIVKCAYHFKQIEGCIDRLNRMVEILHDEELTNERILEGGGSRDPDQGDEAGTW